MKGPLVFLFTLLATSALADHLAPPTNLDGRLAGTLAVDLSWTDNNSPTFDYPYEEDGFYIYYQLPQDDDVRFLKSVGANTTSTRITDLPPNTPIAFYVTTYDELGESYSSNPFFITTGVAAPSAPRNLRVDGLSSTRVDLSWTDTTGASNATEYYEVYRRVTGAREYSYYDYTYFTSYSDDDVDEGVSYDYVVYAVNDNDYSGPSNAVRADVPELTPRAPFGITFPTVTAEAIVVNWNDRSQVEDGFTVERTTDGETWTTVGSVGRNVTSITDREVIQNTDYAYRVYAFNREGRSDAITGFVRTRVLEKYELTVDVKSAIVSGTGAGDPKKGDVSYVSVYDSADGELVWQKIVFPGQALAARPALGDVNGDKVLDVIVAAGEGISNVVNIFDGTNGQLLNTINPYEASFKGGLWVAAADFDKDGKSEVLVGAGNGGAPRIAVYNGMDDSPLFNFYAYEDDFRGGVMVAAGDVNCDGTPDIISGTGVGGGPRVRVFDTKKLNPQDPEKSVFMNFFAYDDKDRFGVAVSSAYVDNDKCADIITGIGPGGGPRVRVFKGATRQVGEAPAGLFDGFAYPEDFRGGVTVAGLSNEGIGGLVTGPGPGGGALVRYLPQPTNPSSKSVDFFTNQQSDRRGIFVGGY